MGEDKNRSSKAVLFGILLPNGREFFGEDPLKELSSLAQAAGAEVVGSLLQRRQTPHPATYLGQGKTEELTELIQEREATLAICDQDLSPAQGRNLEKFLDIRVLDRTELILDLFATRARTAQAKAQVELARLEYALPRLRRMWSHLDREKGGIGLRGAGEKQIEADRRLIRERIRDLKKDLVRLDARATRRVHSRRYHLRVCLVGYASAGKSSLMNALTGADVVVAARPFSTLDTRTRSLDLGRGLKALLSDTVGFIRDIPHHLVASFHATLAEAVHADLLLHVVDISAKSFTEDVKVVEGVLAAIAGSEGQRPRVVLLNKVDLLEDRMELQLADRLLPGAVPVSAVTGIGLDSVRESVRQHLFRTPIQVRLLVPHGEVAFLSEIRKYSVIRSEAWGEDGVTIEIQTEKQALQGLLNQGCILLDPGEG